MSLQNVEKMAPETGNARGTEYRLFQEVTDRLVECEQHGMKDGTDFEKAVNRNCRLWSALKTDLTLQENQLPGDLKARLISIALWVEKHTDLVFDGKGEVEPLITVNQAIMEGLAA
jgi:flagellar protein FlaF